MAFTDMLADIAKALGAFAVVLIAGINGVDGVIMGNIRFTDYILLGIMLIAMLYLFYTLQQMQTNS